MFLPHFDFLPFCSACVFLFTVFVLGLVQIPKSKHWLPTPDQLRSDLELPSIISGAFWVVVYAKHLALRIRLYVLRKGLPLYSYSFRMGLEPSILFDREGSGSLGLDIVHSYNCFKLWQLVAAAFTTQLAKCHHAIPSYTALSRSPVIPCFMGI